MREIKFRGKRIDNDEWVCGSLVVLPDKTLITTAFDYDKYLKTWTYTSNEVIPETVGQMVEKYKNGTERYIGDILQITYESHSEGHIDYITDVRWEQGVAMVDVRGEEFETTPISWLWEINSIASVKCIGNIYENKELLEVK